VSYALIIASLALLLVLCVAARPRLTLDPQAVTLHKLLRSRSVGWDRWLPGSPSPPANRNPWWLTAFRTPDRPGGRPVEWNLPASQLHADPTYLAAVLRYYATYPAERSLIGTEEGLARLHVARSRAVSGT